MASPARNRVPSLKEATKVTPLSTHTYSVTFIPSYCIGAVPNGGIVASNIIAAARLHLAPRNQPDVITAHLSYIDRTSTGLATILITDTKLGRRTSTLHIELYQGDLLPSAPWIGPKSRKCIVGYVTNSNIALETGPTLRTVFTLSPPPPPGRSDAWALVTPPSEVYREAEKRVDFFEPVGGQRARSRVEYWVRPAGGDRWTDASLGFVADCRPHLVFNYLRTGAPGERDDVADMSGETVLEMLPVGTGPIWVPTVVMNMDIKKRLPEEGVEWLYVTVEAKRICRGRQDLEFVIADTEGEIVAIANHTGLVVPAERNTKQKQGSKM